MRFLLVVIVICSGWAAEPVLGTWKLNLGKSHYIPGPAPRSQIRIYEGHADGIKVTIKTIDAEGRATTVEHPVNYDGKEHPLSGPSQADAIVLEKIDDYTSEAILKHANRILGTNRRIVSKDGKTLTITYQGTGARGGTVKNTAVYEKQ
ncbi:MAG: hypothetical protein ACKV2U_26940 [Bryobacteraceae bacterium]